MLFTNFYQLFRQINVRRNRSGNYK